MRADTLDLDVRIFPQGARWFFDVRKTGTTRVYAAMSDGTLKSIDNADYTAVGSPGFKDLPADDPVWSRPASA